MKTKLAGVIIILGVLSISCDSDVQEVNNELLTSTTWTDQSPPATQESNWPESRYTFHKNGDYTLEFGEEMKITGRWKWVSKNEIYLEFKSMTFGKDKHIDLEGQNYNVRILEISEVKLKTFKKFETDAWDSGFAREHTYNAN